MPLPNEEQNMLREMAHNWAQKDSPVRAFRDLRDSDNTQGFDAATLATMAEMGWTGTVIPEEYGGSDFGYWSAGIIVEELGRTLVAAPLIGSAVGAASALKLGGTQAQKSSWLPRIADGSAVAALAIDETAHFAPERIAFGAQRKGDGYTLSGTKRLVHEGLAADVFIVAARTSGSPADVEGVTLFVVPGDTPGIRRERRKMIDHRGYADVSFDDVALGGDAVLGTVGSGRQVLHPVLDIAAATTAAEALGLATQAFETTLDYLKVRVQFGQVIGTFQALQHRAAKMYTDIQVARPTVEEALNALDAGAEDACAAVSLAKATANDLVHQLTREMIQLHGGIGMTDAHDAGFYIKRARVLEAAFGTSAYHRERYGRLLGI
ncbi:MAG: alkylation response protein AidB-like acyl-CoA dehydrogenase [Gammaproteobacteria bacterium]|jgi:alkylation response protein AidB-like acyl-CoA dehydrogenase